MVVYVVYYDNTDMEDNPELYAIYAKEEDAKALVSGQKNYWYEAVNVIGE